VSFSKPKQNAVGASNKFSASYTIVDESVSTPNQAVVLNMFGDAETAFPEVVAVGNVIQCFRCKVGSFRGQTQLTAYTQGGHWVVYCPKIDLKTGLFCYNSPNMAVAQDDTDSSRSRPKSFDIDAWRVTTSDKALQTPEVCDVCTDEESALKLMSLYDWSLSFLHTYSLMDSVTPQEPLATLDAMFRSHLNIQNGRVPPGENGSMRIERADSIVLFLDVVEIIELTSSESNAFIVVWDGTTHGDFILPDSPALKWNSGRSIADCARNAVAAAALLAKNLISENVQSDIDAMTSLLLPFIDVTHATSSSGSSSSSSNSSCPSGILKGMPCVVQLRQNAVAFVKTIPSGTWIKMRNFHVDPPTAEYLPYFTAPHSSNNSEGSTTQFALIGSLRYDSHIVPLPPFARCTSVHGLSLLSFKVVLTGTLSISWTIMRAAPKGLLTRNLPLRQVLT
jgi:hypothetical protein